MMEKLRKSWRAFCMIVVGCLLMIIVVEGGARIVVRSIDRSASGHPLNFSDADIRALYDTDVPEFYREVLSEGWGKGIDRRYEPFVEFVNTPSRGRHVNVDGQGLRVVPGREAPLDEPGPKVFVFGGSTTFGMGVADGETIVAAVQDALDRAGQSFRVYNLAVVSHYSTQERVLFERLLDQGIRPDIAVFIDGLNDFVYCAVPDRTEISDVLANHRKLSVGAELAERSNVVKLVHHYSGKKPIVKNDMNASCQSDAAIEAVVRRLDTNRRMIAAIAASFGIEALFVQQPTPSYGYDNARRAIPLARFGTLAALANTTKGYPLVKKFAEEKGAPPVLWLEDLSIAENMYVDVVHYSPAFNRAIAEPIAEAILRSAKIE